MFTLSSERNTFRFNRIPTLYIKGPLKEGNEAPNRNHNEYRDNAPEHYLETFMRVLITHAP